jgi:hypothetical protein
MLNNVEKNPAENAEIGIFLRQLNETREKWFFIGRKNRSPTVETEWTVSLKSCKISAIGPHFSGQWWKGRSWFWPRVPLLPTGTSETMMEQTGFPRNMKGYPTRGIKSLTSCPKWMDCSFFSFRFIEGIRMPGPLIISYARIRLYRLALEKKLTGLTWTFITWFIG